MTVIQPGLSVRDSQILELLHAGASMDRVVAIGAHRDSWTVQHVAVAIARWYKPERRKPGPKPRPKPAKVVPLRVAPPEHTTATLPASTAAGWVPPPPARPRQVVLTPAQAVVLQQLLRGGSNASISAQLGVVEDTVKSHMRNVLRALDVTDRTNAVIAVLAGQVQVRISDGKGVRQPRQGSPSVGQTCENGRDPEGALTPPGRLTPDPRHRKGGPR